MHNQKRVILHIVFDNVFFDQLYPYFEGMDNYENRYLLTDLNTGDGAALKYIKNSEKIIRAADIEEWGGYVADNEVDIIYLHGLWDNYLKAIDYIGDNVVVMWWCYGMEIYENIFKRPALLPLKIYKPKTHCLCLKNVSKGFHYINAELSYSLPGFYLLAIRLYNRLTGRKGDALKKMLKRIDYIFTPLDIETEILKKKHPYIKAKPYTLRKPKKQEAFLEQSAKRGILFEHSANITNNHLDIIASIKRKKLSLSGRDIVVPLSYGDNNMAEIVSKKVKFDGAKVHCLMEPLPYHEYQEMISNCSHAFFGMIRQSGLGNIFLCFKKGIKVFFFKDSILYKYFIEKGFYVYSIEDDLTDLCISEPLPLEQAKVNFEKYYSIFEDTCDTFQQQIDNILNNRKNG